MLVVEAVVVTAAPLLARVWVFVVVVVVITVEAAVESVRPAQP